jgi:hypothetical protein
MAPRTIVATDSGDIVSHALHHQRERFGLVSRYADRVSATADMRALEREKLMPAAPVKFGRLAKPPASPQRTAVRPNGALPKPTIPAHLLHVIAGHSAQPEPV